MTFSKICGFDSTRNENIYEICVVSFFQLIVSCVCLVLFISGIFYMLVKCKQRYSDILLSFHNLRSSLELALLLLGSLELSATCLSEESRSVKITTGQNISMPFSIFNSIAAILVMITLMAYHRIVEIKYKIEFLYFTCFSEVFFSFFRIYKSSKAAIDCEMFSLESCLQSSSCIFLMSLAILDGTTIYKEFMRPQIFVGKSTSQEQNFGYKHSKSSFLSKVFFWWLTPLLWAGYRTPLEQDDLGALREEDSSRTYYDHFLYIYKTSSSEGKKPSLWRCYLKSSWNRFALGGLFKLVGDLSGLVGPVAITQIVEYIELQQQYGQEAQHYQNKSSVRNIPITLAPYSVRRQIQEQITNNYTTDNRNGYDMGLLTSLVTHDTKIYYTDWTELLSNGWVIAWLVLIASIAQGALSQASTHIVNMIGIRMKTSLQGLIYRKILLLSTTCLHEVGSNTKENIIKDTVMRQDSPDYLKKDNQATTDNKTMAGGAKDAGAITNLMSEDALNVMTFFWVANYVWAIPLKIGVVMYLLYLKLGISAIVGSVLCIAIMTPLQFFIGKALSENSERGAECTDARLKRTNDVFLSIRLIKLNAWEKVFKEKIAACRKLELKYLDRDAVYWTLMTFLTHVSSVLITFVTLVIFMYYESEYPDTSKLRSTALDGMKEGVNSSLQHDIQLDVVSNGDSAKPHIMEFTASRLFSALALFNQLTVPLFIFPITIPIIISAVVSTRRIERFLKATEVHKQFEGIRNMARILCQSDASLDVDEDDEKLLFEKACYPSASNDETLLSSSSSFSKRDEQKFLKKNKSGTPTLVVKQNFGYNENVTLAHPLENSNKNYSSPEFQVRCDVPHTCEKLQFCTAEKHRGKELIRNSRIEKSSRHKRQKSTSSRDSFQFQSTDQVAVIIRNAVFSWTDNPSSGLCLKVPNVEIPRGKLTVIVGKSGSGKTSLLCALLKEMPQLSGEFCWNKYATFAYVSQIPWLLNASIRENIIFGEPFRPRRFEKVLEACCLKPDIEIMPDADLTLIGERGINISGGQKQRITIARALYSSANVVIMDDPLSSLDNEVAKHVLENGIKQVLLRANRTVVMVTQKLYVLPCSDYIIAVENGSVQFAGTYSTFEQEKRKLLFEWNTLLASKKTGLNDNSEHSCNSSGKTARERWKLFKNVSKVSLQKLQCNGGVGHHEDDLLSSTHPSYKRMVIQTTSSRYLMYEIPFPTDDVVFRSKSYRVQRERLCHSLEVKTEKKLNNVMRLSSLQPHIESSEGGASHFSQKKCTPIDDLENNSSKFKGFLNRISYRRWNNSFNKSQKPLNAAGSFRSILDKSCASVNKLQTNSLDGSNNFDEDTSSVVCGDTIPHKEIYNEERKYGKITLDIYHLYISSCGIPIVVLFLLTTLLWQSLRVFTDVWLSNWTELDGDENKDPLYCFKIYTMISFASIIVAMISTPVGQLAGCKARRLLHEKILGYMLSKPLHFFQVTPLGRIINRFSNDMSIIDKKITATSQRLVQFMFLCVCAVLINAIITPWFVLLAIPVCGFYFIIQKFYRCSSRELQRLENLTNSPIISHFSETIQGIGTIRAFSQEARFTEILFKKLEANSLTCIILNSSNRWLGIALDCLGGAIVFISILTALIVTSTSFSYSEHVVTDNLDIDLKLPQKRIPSAVLPSPSFVGLAINYTLLVPIYLNWVVKLLADMEMYIGAVERIAFYQNDNGNSHSNENCKYKSAPPISWPQRGDITFQNVFLRYKGQEQSVIKDLTLKIPAGQRIGVCGRTGSGKSSLALSLFGVVEIIQGAIRIDGVDINTIHPDELRSRLSIIPQDVYLFTGSIRENLDPRNHYTDLELWNCLEVVQLKDCVNSMSKGLETEINDGGTGKFSAGQRQLVCLARAVLRGSVCLVLDEATSALDEETETKFMKAAEKAFQGRTIITIAHRISTIMDYDRIVVFENGAIIEDGNPEELKQKVNGRFKMLVESGQN